VETTFASTAFSQQLSRIFPATEKSLFLQALPTLNKEKMRHRSKVLRLEFCEKLKKNVQLWKKPTQKPGVIFSTIPHFTATTTAENRIFFFQLKKKNILKNLKSII
jgi:hypothetical protein